VEPWLYGRTRISSLAILWSGAFLVSSPRFDLVHALTISYRIGKHVPCCGLCTFSGDDVLEPEVHFYPAAAALEPMSAGNRDGGAKGESLAE